MENKKTLKFTNMKKYSIYLSSDRGLVTFNTFSENVETAINTSCRSLFASRSQVLRVTFEELN